MSSRVSVARTGLSPRGITFAARALQSVAVVVLLSSPSCTRHARSPGDSLVLTGARVYTAPTDPPLENAAVHVSGDRIVHVGPRDAFPLPPDATVIDCSGRTVTAGFWNSHAHFIEPRWQQAASAPAADLSAGMRQMFLRHGFTTVFDTGSPWPVAEALRRRTASGEVAGPRILTVGPIVFPGGGAPGPAMAGVFGPALQEMPEAGTPDEGTALAAAAFARGADGMKVYVATWWNDPPTRMPPGVVDAIARIAGERHKPLFAHPSDATGIETALAAGVNVLTHTTPAAAPWSEHLAARLVERNVALTPTLTLWRVELERTGVPADTVRAVQQRAVDQLRLFVQAGGQVLFGTDVGYIDADDPAEEYRLMAAAGMGARQILASLTTAPSERFGRTGDGRVAAGQPADLVVLDGDPAHDVAAFSRVARVIRAGRVVYSGDER